MTDISVDDLIDGLADTLRPVRPRRIARGWLLAGACWLATAALLLWWFGMRHDMTAMPPLSMLGFWLIAAVAVAAIWSALRMGLPGVGRDYSGWRWAVLAALALPLTALFVAMGDNHAAAAGMRDGTHCLMVGLFAGLGVGGALFAWLRAGAPTSPTRAGRVIGLAAGASGAAITALHCPQDNIVHIALWHGGAVLLATLASRLMLPRYLRW